MNDIVSLKSRAERYYNRGSNASYAGRLPEAVYYMRKAVSADRTNKRYILDFISVLNQIGFYEETVSYGAEALSMCLENADKATVLFHMGEACYCLGLNDASKRYICKSIETDPEGLYAKDAVLYKAELDTADESQDYISDDLTEGILRYHTGGDLNMALNECRNICSGDPCNIQAQELLTAIYVSMGNYEAAYKAADKITGLDTGNVTAMLFGYISAVHMGNVFGKKRYGAMLSRLRDCTDYEMQTLCHYFNGGTDDVLAKEVFASIYQENTFWKDSGFALAAAFYNNGETNAALSALERLRLLEGGRGIASLCLKNLHMDRPPARLGYVYAPTDEQMDMLCTELFAMLDEPQAAEDYYNALEENLTLAVRYAETASMGDIMGGLRLDDDNVKAIIKRMLLDYSLEPSKKLMLALLIKDSDPHCNYGVNMMGDIVQLSEITNKFYMRNFDVPAKLEEEYGRQAVSDVYREIPQINVLSMDSPDEEFAFVANLMLLSATATPISTEELCAHYGILTERGREIFDILTEKGII